MSKVFTAAEWRGLTNNERASLCRNLAEEAERAAQSAGPKLQEDFKHVAVEWKLLAAEIEVPRGNSNCTVGFPVVSAGRFLL